MTSLGRTLVKDEVGSNNTNCDGCDSPWDYQQAASVGSFASNQIGLYDMSGNVWEWTYSNRRNQFDGSEQQCNDATTDTHGRVLRGGSWFNSSDFVHAALRYDFPPYNRLNDLGFRMWFSSPIE